MEDFNTDQTFQYFVKIK